MFSAAEPRRHGTRLFHDQYKREELDMPDAEIGRSATQPAAHLWSMEHIRSAPTSTATINAAPQHQFMSQNPLTSSPTSHQHLHNHPLHRPPNPRPNRPHSPNHSRHHLRERHLPLRQPHPNPLRRRPPPRSAREGNLRLRPPRYPQRRLARVSGNVPRGADVRVVHERAGVAGALAAEVGSGVAADHE